MELFRSKPPPETDLIAKRIELKKDLWEFIREMSSELTAENLDRDEVVTDLCKTVIRMLKPGFSFVEIHAELINLLDTLIVPLSRLIADKMIEEMGVIVKSSMKKRK